MKDEYRKKYLSIRKNIENKDLKDENIYRQLIKNKKIISANIILIYVSKVEEVDTIKLINYLLKHKKVAVPKIENDMMNFYYIDSIEDLKEGYFKVSEPTTNDIVKDFTGVVSITPGICFSKNLYRLGYGKGYYDKFYSIHKNIYKIGLCYKELLLDNIPHNKYDIKVDEIITNKIVTNNNLM